MIGLVDMMGAGDNLISRNFGHHSLETYLALAMIYWIIFIVVEQSTKYLEKHLSQSQVIASKRVEVTA